MVSITVHGVKTSVSKSEANTRTVGPAKWKGSNCVQSVASITSNADRRLPSVSCEKTSIFGKYQCLVCGQPILTKNKTTLRLLCIDYTSCCESQMKIKICVNLLRRKVTKDAERRSDRVLLRKQNRKDSPRHWVKLS